MSGCTCRPFIPVCTGSGSGMQNPLANFIGVFSLVRDVRGFQVNPLCCHNITSLFPPSGNGGYVRNLLALSTFSYNVRLCITTDACILVQSLVSGLDIRTAQRHKASIKDTRDCWRNSHARTSEALKHTHIWSAYAHTSEALTHTYLKRLHSHIWTARTQTAVRQSLVFNCANTKLGSPLLFWAWMNKFRQSYIKMHVLANILVNSRLRKEYVLM